MYVKGQINVIKLQLDILIITCCDARPYIANNISFYLYVGIPKNEHFELINEGIL